MTDVFLSYSRKDTDSVKELFESLGARKREVWIDLHGIEYSSKWWDEICAGIDGADNFVFIVSQNSLESLFCHREIQYALKHNKRIIPFLLRQVDPKAMVRAWQNDPELCKYEQITKENWESIQSIQWIDFTQINDTEKGVDALLETVDSDPERVKLHTRLLLRMRDWVSTGQNPSGLLRGDELNLYEQWFADSIQQAVPPHPTNEQEAYITESRRVQDELEMKRVQRERLVKRFRVASFALGVLFIGAVVAIFLSIQREAQTKVQVAAGNTQIAIAGKTLTPIPPTLTAVAQTVVAGGYLIESQNLAAMANTILQNEGGNTEKAALLSIRVLRKVYLSSADSALMMASKRLNAVPFTIPLPGFFPQVAFSPDGTTFVTGMTGGADPNVVELRDSLTGNIIWSNNADFAKISSIAFSPDGTMIVVATSNQSAVLIDAETGQKIRVFQSHKEPFDKAIFSPDSKFILTTERGSASIWDVETGKQVTTVSSGQGAPIIFFLPDGRAFFVAEHVYNMSDGSRNNNYPIGGGALAISPDGKSFLNESGAANLELQNTVTGSIIRNFSGHTDSVISAAFSSDGKWLITGSEDNTARVWEVSTGKQVLLLTGNTIPVESVAVSPDGTKLLTGSNNARLWTKSTIDQQFTFSVPSTITATALSPNEKMMLIGDGNGNSRLWDIYTGTMIFEFPRVYHDVKTVAISPDGELVAISLQSFSNTDSIDVDLFDSTTGALVKTITFNFKNSFITALVFSPDGNTLLVTKDDGLTNLVDIESGQVLRQFIGFGSTPVISPDGNLVTFNGGTQWWNIATGTKFTLEAGMNGNLEVFSADGKLIAFASGTNEISVWDFSTQTLINRFSGHSDQITSLAISPDNKWLLSGSVDKTARLWNIDSGQMTRVYSGHTAAINSVRFIENGKKIITTGMDSTVRIWITDYNDLLTYVCTLVGSDFTMEERVLYGISDQDPTCPQFGQQPQSQAPTPTPLITLTPVPIWTPIATPTQGDSVP